jgi:hypothetical protein
MNSRKLHAYEVLLRMARVKELRADAALAEAVGAEAVCKTQVDALQAARTAVIVANSICVASGQRMDMARYELLTMLDASLSDMLQVTVKEHDAASSRRVERASENVAAQRYRERVGEHLDHTRTAIAHDHAVKAQEDAVELWLESRGEGE